MLDLKNMPDEEFSILVTPSAPQAAMNVKVEETGSVLLSSKVAEKLAKMPVQIRFNKDCTAIQISAAGSADSVTFPKNGRKTVPNAAKILRENRIQYLETMEEAQKKSKEPHPTGHTGMAGVGSKQLPESLLAYGKEWSCTASNLNRKTRTGRILQHP